MSPGKQPGQPGLSGQFADTTWRHQAMQLLAKVADVSLLQRTCIALEKQQHRAGHMRLTRAVLELAVVPASAEPTGVVLWASLDARDVYEEIHIESKNNDTIVLALSFEHLSKAIKSVLLGQDIYLKLIKRGTTKMLAVFSKSPTSNGLQTTVEQCIPIDVLRPDDAARIRVPTTPEAQINVVLPAAQSLRTVLDRMKAMGSQVVVTVSRQGELHLHVASDAVDVVTEYKGLQIAVPVSGSTQSTANGGSSAGAVAAATADTGSPGEVLEARVDVKELHRALAVHAAQPSFIVCSISTGRTMIIYASLDMDGRNRNFVATYLPSRLVTAAE